MKLRDLLEKRHGSHLRSLFCPFEFNFLSHLCFDLTNQEKHKHHSMSNPKKMKIMKNPDVIRETLVT